MLDKNGWEKELCVSSARAHWLIAVCHSNLGDTSIPPLACRFWQYDDEIDEMPVLYRYGFPYRHARLQQSKQTTNEFINTRTRLFLSVFARWPNCSERRTAVCLVSRCQCHRVMHCTLCPLLILREGLPTWAKRGQPCGLLVL